MEQESLFEATMNGDIDVVRLLIDRAREGANLHVKNNFGYTLLHYATGNGHIDVMRLLIEHGARINEKDNSGWTSLHFAATCRKTDIVRLLIEKGASINEKNNYGRTPLHVAALYRHTNVARLLIEKGACMNEKDKNGHTPLHIVARNGNIDIMRLLIENGARMNEKDNEGLTALQNANNVLWCMDTDPVYLFHDLELRKRNIIKRMSLQVLSSCIEPSQDYNNFRSRHVVSIMNYIQCKEDLASARSVCKVWRSLADSTLEQRPCEFFSFSSF
jgi:ankyrin repeat protein